MTSKTAYVVFRIGPLRCGLDCADVRRILPLPALDRPPGMPRAIDGVLDFAGTAVPVLRLDRLFDLPDAPRQIYQHLILLSSHDPPIALLADRVTDVVSLSQNQIASLLDGETFNGCVVGQARLGDDVVNLLSAARIFDERERHLLAEFQAMRTRRLEEFRGPPQ